MVIRRTLAIPLAIAAGVLPVWVGLEVYAMITLGYLPGPQEGLLGGWGEIVFLAGLNAGLFIAANKLWLYRR